MILQMNKLKLLLILYITLQSCEYKIKKQENTNPEIKIQKLQNLPEINAITDTVKISDQTKKYSNLLFDIEGNYYFKNDIADCKIHLSLFYKYGILKYNMETNTRKILGNAIITLNERKDGYYIKFKDIEWSEYLGAIDAESETPEENLPLPQDVEGALYKNEITIQNYGNAMNYYVQLGECDVKYIHLIK